MFENTKSYHNSNKGMVHCIAWRFELVHPVTACTMLSLRTRGRLYDMTQYVAAGALTCVRRRKTSLDAALSRVRHAFIWPIIANMTSSTKPEMHIATPPEGDRALTV